MPDIERIKVGRNDPCPCGKKRANGLPMKYKNCCLKNKKIPVRIKISRKDFIGSPYTECPKCKENTFGVSLATAIGNRNSFGKECTECGHKAGFKLPEIKKSKNGWNFQSEHLILLVMQTFGLRKEMTM